MVIDDERILQGSGGSSSDDVPPGPPEGCEYVKVFGATRTNKVERNLTGFCSDLKWTCCGMDTFNKMRDWWMKPQTGKAKSEMQMSFDVQREWGSRVRSILDQENLIGRRAQMLFEKCAFKDGLEDCALTSGIVLYSMKISPFHQFKKIWMNNATKCWTYLSNFRLGSFCAVCDSTFKSRVVDIEGTKTITIHREEAQKFLTECYDYIHTDSTVLTLFSQVSSLFSFDDSGKKIAGKKDVDIVIDVQAAAKRQAELDICMRNPSNEKCLDLVSRQLNFKLMIHFNLQLITQMTEMQTELFKDLKIPQKNRIIEEYIEANERMMQSSSGQFNDQRDMKGYFNEFLIKIGQPLIVDKNDGIKFTLNYPKGPENGFQNIDIVKSVDARILSLGAFLASVFVYLTSFSS